MDEFAVGEIVMARSGENGEYERVELLNKVVRGSLTIWFVKPLDRNSRKQHAVTEALVKRVQ